MPRFAPIGVELSDIAVAHETPLEEVGGRVGIDASVTYPSSGTRR
ncbi:hypothetical protein EGH25_01880 [Haladaptatus sp. F3-133]|uniref:Uncharacterized protein n=1 Tax=Halorutilus salinus TaxID=2487751 RepID=A0A9Q4GFF8_9EURY|nr:hypothetical protein [Halorutilus salinus]MCX2818104.1 hypothetical protein [Halorutilus salinus]